MALETRKFNYLAAITAMSVAVLLGGAVWALVDKQITFAAFAATVGSPVSALVGWAARGAVVEP